MTGPISRRTGEPLTLDMLKVAVQRRVSPHLGAFVRESLTLDARAAEMLTGDLVVELRAYLLAEKREVWTERSAPLTLDIVVPATPWHHFRHLHAGAWWQRLIERRRPIRYTIHKRTGQMTASLTRFLTYPHADVPYRGPQLGPPVTYWQPEHTVSWRDIDDLPPIAGPRP